MKRENVEEVTACSTGNHGAAVAFAAKTLGVPATIFLPENPNPVKRKKIEDLGARVVMTGSTDLAEASRRASEYSARPGVYFLNDATDPVLPAGPGTIGLEIIDQLPDVASIYVPMGDTALIRGVGAAVKQLKPSVRIIGVQAERAPSMSSLGAPTSRFLRILVTRAPTASPRACPIRRMSPPSAKSWTMSCW